jgi:hypothetical protein
MNQALVFLLLASHRAAGVSRTPHPTLTSICVVLRSPERFNGKMVRVKGQIEWGLEDLWIYEDCEPGQRAAIPITIPDEGADPHLPFRVLRDSDFQRFSYYLNAPPVATTQRPVNTLPNVIPRRYCSLSAVFTGRFETVSVEDASHGRGFGHAGGDRFQLVIRGVATPVAKECESTSDR